MIKRHYFRLCTVIVIEGLPSPSRLEIYAMLWHIGGVVLVTKGDASTAAHAVVQCSLFLVSVIPLGASDTGVLGVAVEAVCPAIIEWAGVVLKYGCGNKLLGE
jgi:hypothetical protein